MTTTLNSAKTDVHYEYRVLLLGDAIGNEEYLQHMSRQQLRYLPMVKNYVATLGDPQVVPLTFCTTRGPMRFIISNNPKDFTVRWSKEKYYMRTKLHTVMKRCCS